MSADQDAKAFCCLCERARVYRRGERYCKDCRKAILKQMGGDGYLTPKPFKIRTKCSDLFECAICGSTTAPCAKRNAVSAVSGVALGAFMTAAPRDFRSSAAGVIPIRGLRW